MTNTLKHQIFWIALFAAIFLFIGAVSAILLPFVVGILIAYFLDPAADRLEKAGASRTLATLMILVGFLSLMVIVGLLLFPLLFEQFTQLINRIPEYANQLNAKYSPIVNNYLDKLDSKAWDSLRTTAGNYSGEVLNFMAGFLAGLWHSGLAAINLLSLIFVSPVVSFYMLRDWDKMVAKLDTLLPRDHAATIRQQMREIDRTISGYVRGQTNVCLFLGIFYAIGLTLVGLDFGLFIGLATGLLSFIPYVGMFFGATMGLGVAYFQYDGDMTHIAQVAIVFIIGQILEGNFVAPKLVGDKINLHPVWIIFALLAGGALFGFIGILLAVPVAGILGVLVRFAVGYYMNSHYYSSRLPKIKRK